MGDGTVFELSPGAPRRGSGFISRATADRHTGDTVSPAIAVNVENASGNVVAADDSTVTLAIASGPAGATLGGMVSAVAVNGVATFPNLSLNQVGMYTLTASDGTLSPTSTSIRVIAPSLVAPTFGRVSIRPQ